MPKFCMGTVELWKPVQFITSQSPAANNVGITTETLSQTVQEQLPKGRDTLVMLEMDLDYMERSVSTKEFALHLEGCAYMALI